MSPLELILIIFKVYNIKKDKKNNSKIKALRKIVLSSQILDALSRCLFYILFWMASNMTNFAYSVSGGPIAFSSLILILYNIFGKTTVIFLF